MSEPVNMWEGCQTDTLEDIARFYEPDLDNAHTREPAYIFGSTVFYQKKNPYDDNEPMTTTPGGRGGDSDGWRYK